MYPLALIAHLLPSNLTLHLPFHGPSYISPQMPLCLLTTTNHYLSLYDHIIPRFHTYLPSIPRLLSDPFEPTCAPLLRFACFSAGPLLFVVRTHIPSITILFFCPPLASNLSQVSKINRSICFPFYCHFWGS